MTEENVKPAKITTPKEPKAVKTARIEVSFVNLNFPLFMHGANLGDKIEASKKNVKIEHDPVTGHLYFLGRGKVTMMSDVNAKSIDYASVKDGGFNQKVITESEKADAPVPVEAASTDPLDMDAAAHRARVRAASANANKQTGAQASLADTQALVEQARAVAMGLKSHTKTSYGK